MNRAILFLALLFATAVGGAVHAGETAVDFSAVVERIATEGDAAVAAYRPESGADTADWFSDLYFDHFEGSGMEQAIGLRDPALKSRIESQFAAVIGAASRGDPARSVAGAWITLRESLIATERQFDQMGQEGFWTTLLQAFLILLREGFEAMLVVTALVAYLRKSGAGDKAGVVYQGVGWALAASLLTAYLLSAVFDISGAGQEGIEGITLLLASGVLFYVSYWLVSKREAARWQAYVQSRIDQALSRGSLFALGAAAFLAVYREGAETVLFYQALIAQSEGQATATAAGFFAAAVALVGIYLAMRLAAIRLPLGLFFTVTAALLYYLSVSFAGHGILELQEAGWLPITPVEGVPEIPWLGLFPTGEGLAVQGTLLLLLVPALIWWRLKRAARVEESAAG
ncbi:MAG: hypothetical protein Kow006_22440 [Gammaproteobacteria bacterium]